MGNAVALAATCRPFIGEARVQFHICACGICGGQSDTGKVSLHQLHSHSSVSTGQR